MKYYSEKIDKLYDTEEELFDDEKAFEQAKKERAKIKAEEQLKAKQLEKEKAERLEEIKTLWKQSEELRAKGDELYKKYRKDYVVKKPPLGTLWDIFYELGLG